MSLFDYSHVLPSILYLACFLLCVLGVVLLIAVKNVFATRVRLDKYRTKKDGVADLLLSAFLIDDGIVCNKNGSLMAAFKYEGHDDNSASFLERNANAAKLNSILAELDQGFMIHVDCIRKPAPKYFRDEQSHFPDRVSAAIEDVRKNYFNSSKNIYNSMFILTITYFPPSLKERKLVEMMYSKDQNADLNKKTPQEFILETFHKRLNDLQQKLSKVFVNVERLKGFDKPFADGTTKRFDLFLSYLNLCVNGIDQLIEIPKIDMPLDCILANQDLVTGVEPKIGKNYIKVISIEGYAAQSTPGMLNALTDINSTYRWNTRFIFLDKPEQLKLVKKIKKQWQTKKFGFIDRMMNKDQNLAKANQDALRREEEAQASESLVSEGSVSFGFFTQCIVLMNENPLKLANDVKVVKDRLMDLGLTSREESVNSMDAFFGSLPGHGYENQRRSIVNTMNVAHLFPMSTPYVGNINATCNLYPFDSSALMQCVTGNSLNTPFSFNFHVNNVGHTMILGLTGRGKSTFLCTCIAQSLRYLNAKVFAFDKDLSMYVMCKAMGGTHFRPADGNKLCFAPLSDLNGADNKEAIGWCCDWVESILRLNDVEVTPSITNSINEAMLTLAKTKASNPSTELSLSVFHATVQNQTVRETIEPYLLTGAMGELLDSSVDYFKSSNLNVIELNSLMQLGDKYSIPVLLYIFRRIEKSLDGSPAFIYMDEAWMMLKNKVFSSKMEDWLRTLRKFNCSVIFATQNLSDVIGSSITDVLMGNCFTKIFLPNDEAFSNIFYPLYVKFGLNDAQIGVINNGTPMRDYYVCTPNGSRQIQLALDKFQLAFVGASDRKTIKLADTLMEKYGENNQKWVDEYLATKNLKIPKYINDKYGYDPDNPTVKKQNAFINNIVPSSPDYIVDPNVNTQQEKEDQLNTNIS